jgi:lipid-A-disaccharide synthase
MGLGPVIRRLPLLMRRIRETAASIAAERPDILVTIDAPDFSKRVARRVRVLAPDIPIIHWVCPSVWAWRPGRAPAMRPYIDHVLCLLPFEPAALQRLSGPPGTYIGHPLIERIDEMRPGTDEERRQRATDGPVLLLPGSRVSEIRRLLPLFLAATDQGLPKGTRRVIPTLPHLEALVKAEVGARDIAIVTGEAAKYAAFRSARAALAASGTVTLELALAGIPIIAAYRVAAWEAFIAPNLVLGENLVPEFIQEAATADNLRAALLPLLSGAPEASRQRDGFIRLEALMREDGLSPSAHAASVVLDLALKPRDRLGHVEPAS